MPTIDRTKLIALEKKSQRRVNDLTEQLRQAKSAVTLAKSPSLRDALHAKQKRIDHDLQTAKQTLAGLRAKLDAGSPAGDAA